MKFYIELLADKYGNTAFAGTHVFSGVITPYEAGVDNRYKMVGAPDSIIGKKWPSGVLIDLYGGFAEVEGPGRELTYEEWEALSQGKTRITSPSNN